MINIKQLDEINNLVLERRKLTQIINQFNKSISLGFIEVDNQHKKRIAYDEAYIKKYVSSELTQANEMILNKLNQELENVENKLAQHIDLT